MHLAVWIGAKLSPQLQYIVTVQLGRVTVPTWDTGGCSGVVSHELDDEG